MKLHEDEKLVIKSVAQNCSFNGYPINGNLYLTDKRLIFVTSKTGETTLDITVGEIEKISKYKILFFITNGFVLYLKNGMQYSLAFWRYNQFISVLRKNDNIEIVQKSKHRGISLDRLYHLPWIATIILSVIFGYFIFMPIAESAIDSYNRMIFTSDPIGYIESLEDENDDPSWCPANVEGYPNLNGQWYFYDDNNDCKYYLDLKITDKGKKGLYKLNYKYDQQADFSVMSSGKFKVVYGKNQYGDNCILGVKEDTPESAYEYSYQGHIFSINDWTPGNCLRLGPFSDVHNNMFGEQMFKTSNKTDD